MCSDSNIRAKYSDKDVSLTKKYLHSKRMMEKKKAKNDIYEGGVVHAHRMARVIVPRKNSESKVMAHFRLITGLYIFRPLHFVIVASYYKVKAALVKCSQHVHPPFSAISNNNLFTRTETELRAVSRTFHTSCSWSTHIGKQKQYSTLKSSMKTGRFSKFCADKIASTHVLI